MASSTVSGPPRGDGVDSKESADRRRSGERNEAGDGRGTVGRGLVFELEGQADLGAKGRDLAVVDFEVHIHHLGHAHRGELESTDLAVRASVAIPGVLPPVPIGDELHIDGGVLDNLPVDLLENDPSISTIIAVDVTPPRGPRASADYGLSVSGWKALRQHLGRSKSDYPGVVTVLMRTMLLGSTRDRDRAVQSGVIDLYLDLELRGVSLLDFENVEPVAARGYEASKDRIDAWLNAGGFGSTGVGAA